MYLICHCRTFLLISWQMVGRFHIYLKRLGVKIAPPAVGLTCTASNSCPSNGCTYYSFKNLCNEQEKKRARWDRNKQNHSLGYWDWTSTSTTKLSAFLIYCYLMSMTAKSVTTGPNVDKGTAANSENLMYYGWFIHTTTIPYNHDWLAHQSFSKTEWAE